MKVLRNIAQTDRYQFHIYSTFFLIFDYEKKPQVSYLASIYPTYQFHSQYRLRQLLCSSTKNCYSSMAHLFAEQFWFTDIVTDNGMMLLLTLALYISSARPRFTWNREKKYSLSFCVLFSYHCIFFLFCVYFLLAPWFFGHPYLKTLWPERQIEQWSA